LLDHCSCAQRIIITNKARFRLTVRAGLRQATALLDTHQVPNPPSRVSGPSHVANRDAVLPCARRVLARRLFDRFTTAYSASVRRYKYSVVVRQSTRCNRASSKDFLIIHTWPAGKREHMTGSGSGAPQRGSKGRVADFCV